MVHDTMGTMQHGGLTRREALTWLATGAGLTALAACAPISSPTPAARQGFVYSGAWLDNA
jgi:hypothetical protein